MCGALHGTGVCSEDHQQGQMQRQGKLQRQKSTAHISGNKRLLVFKIAKKKKTIRVVLRRFILIKLGIKTLNVY